MIFIRQQLYLFQAITCLNDVALAGPSSCGKPPQMARNAADMVKSSCEKCGSGILPPIPAAPSIYTTAPFRAAVIRINFLPAVKINKYNTLSYLWAASIMAGFFWAGSGWGAITFPSIPANMQSFVFINISSHVCYHVIGYF